MGYLRRFLILLKKNWILRKRHYIVTTFEILPVFMCLLFLWLKSEPSAYSYHRDDSYKAAKIYQPRSVIPKYFRIYSENPSVFYVPDDNATLQFVQKVAKKLETLFPRKISSDKTEFTGFRTESKLLDYLEILKLNSQNTDSDDKPLFAFISKPGFGEEFVYGLWIIEKYASITKSLFRPFEDFHSDYFSHKFQNLDLYQSVINEIYLQKYHNKTKDRLSLLDKKIYIQQFPAPAIDGDGMASKLYSFLGTMLIGLSFLIFVSSFMVRIISEKASRMKEFLKLTGMTTGMHWGSWFINGFVFMAVLCLIITLLMSSAASEYVSIISNGNKGLIFMFFMMYAVSTIFFCFAVSVFFTKAVFGCLVMVMLWLFSIFAPALGYSSLLGAVRISSSLKAFSCLLPNFALYCGLNAILNFDEAGSGLQMSNFHSTILDANVSLGKVELIMFFSWILNIFIMWYFQAVWPWQSGVRRPFYFPFTKSYWFGARSSEFDNYGQPNNSGKYFEMNGHNQSAGIEFRRLSKIFSECFKPEKVAVDNISLKLFKGQITALLGHNGSGKTTTISMITGMFPPNAGSVMVNGFDIAKNLNQARRSMGFCPQESIFFNELTVEEHLELVGVLKGCDTTVLKDDILRVCEAVQIKDKLTALASTLSGGMKRKLSLAMAMIGGSETLLLDEPTSGLDPEARRQVWDMLLSIRLNKTILLTTHYMEEADALGDRIAIMTHGRIFCCGSPMFLKERFGAGYHLRMVKNDDCDVQKLEDIIGEHFPAKLERSSGQELSFQVSASNMDEFSTLFGKLEKGKHELGIESFGMSVTNMEDVFLKVGDIVDSEIDAEKENKDKTASDLAKVAAANKFYIHLAGFDLISVQLYGLFLKRFHYNRRQISSLIIQVITPTLLVFGALSATILIQGLQTAAPPAEYSLSKYGSTKVVYQSDSEDTSTVFDKIVRDLGSTPVRTSNVSDTLLDIGTRRLYDYKHFHIVAANFTADRFTAIYNPLASFSRPISVNLMYNTILKSIKSSASIHMALGFYDLAVYEGRDDSVAFGFIVGCMFPVAFAFITCFCVMFVIVERTSKSKHLQLMTKLNCITFWLGHFTYDFCICFICCLPIIIILATDTIGFARSSESMGASFFAIILYIMAALPLHYLTSFIINRPAIAFTILIIVETIIAQTMAIFTTVVRAFPYFPTKIKDDFDIADWVFKFFPTYSITKILTTIKIETSKLHMCDSYKDLCPVMKNKEFHDKCCLNFKEFEPLSMDKNGCGKDFLILFVSMLIFFALLGLLESPFSDYLKKLIERMRWRSTVRLINEYSSSNDVDIQNNMTKIDDIVTSGMYNEEESYALLVHNLTKKFPKVKAVDGITFGVEKSKCFGLLGVNGAGKTTSFSMLTGDLTLTDGNAYIGSIGLRSKKTQFQQRIGYCPQFDTNLDLMSGEEMLYLFARLRGIPRSEIKKSVTSLIETIDLQEHAKKISSSYSGGNKRKLSIGIAMVGLPPLIFLDEPTSGIDPVARRQIWGLLTSIKAAGISLVLTSHSMEECEALCDCLTIMVNGQLQCMGSVTHLRNKYGIGFMIQAKVKFTNTEADASNIQIFKDKMKVAIPSSVVKSEHLGTFSYHVCDVNETWSHMFAMMEEIKASEILENYSISSTSLEQVFLSFAKMQRN